MNKGHPQSVQCTCPSHCQHHQWCHNPIKFHDITIATQRTLLQAHTLQWRHNGHDGVSNHLPHDCLLNHLFRRRSKETSKLRVTCLCVWRIHWASVNSLHKWPVTLKMFPFDDIIMINWTEIVLKIYGLAVEHNFISLFTGAEPWMFDSVYATLQWGTICYLLYVLIIIIVQTYLKTLNL